MKKTGNIALTILALCATILILGGCPQPTPPIDTTPDAQTRNFWVDNNIDNSAPNQYNFVQIEAVLAYQTDR